MPDIDLDQFTPTQRKIVEILMDGKSHHRKELHGCLWDEQGPETNVRIHLTAIRRKIEPLGLGITSQNRTPGGCFYRMVRFFMADEHPVTR